MKNLSKDRVRVPIVNKVKAAVFGFHLPSTVSRVTNIKIGRSWWKARWTTTSRWAKTRQHCRLTICMKLVELSVSDDKIQITILILRRGALSSKDGIEDEDGRRGSLWDYQVETAGLESFIEIR